MADIILYNQQNLIGGGEKTAQLYRRVLSQKHALKYLEGPLSITKVVELIRQKYEHAVNSCYTPSLSTLLWSFTCALSSMKTTTICHGIWFLEAQAASSTPSRPGLLLFTRLQQWLLFSVSDTVVVYSQYQAQLIRAYFPQNYKKVSIIPPAIKPTTHILPKTASFPRKLLIATRIERRKGIHLALKAVSLLQHSNWTLKLVFPSNQHTDWEYFAELTALIDTLHINDQVQLVTGVTPNRIFSHFIEADAFIMSSTDQETFGWTTLEAISVGCPVVGFQTGATAEVLGSQLTPALLTPCITPLSLAGKIAGVLSLNQVQLDQVRQACRRRSQFFSPSKFTRNLERVFHE